ncbi:peptidoglycan DD-metalloendopeptidase family protein [Litoribacter alkaliphilus]|uniref:Peptidoglycan DD-metalloendopeptidase family protein n=1 Tax=Litoribacter ruber TaxID=702568 RepID=A0AAP2CGZ8_9BACT|nr:peptidoglycan DD-metalloendopeptidase family protein [Litoribacter alkaliphilus]MBS9523585.1 peptidoglycan DD-metalloendopeptidase family protein [Litoribacter alkaliphilus]
MKKIWMTVGFVLLVAAGYSYLKYNKQDKELLAHQDLENEVDLEDEIIEEIEEILYGITINDLDITEGLVGKNQTLSTILSPFNVPYQIIDELAKKSKDIFDVRKIAFNKKYTVLTPKDSAQAQFFIYEPNPAEFVVFRLDSVDIYKEAKPMELRKREVAGTITKSLYVNMVEQGVTPDLIDQFADLYGWTVDFQRVHKGDKFKVIYNEKVVDDHVVGVEDIEVAYFEHLGTPYHAIPFEQNGEIAYFDQEGNSLKKAFLRDPLKYTRISSRYNLKRFHPVQKRYKPHLGTDYAAPTGTEIRSVGDGTVVESKFTSANGNYIKIKHNGTYTTQYLHMSKRAVAAGTRVRQGQVIGYVGSTGLATGPHLCFRFWKNGKQEDWLKEKIPPSAPIAKDNRMAYERLLMEKLDQLANIPYAGEEQPLLTSAE